MAKYTKIEQSTCIACGACSSEAPDVYSELATGIAFSSLDDNAGTTEIPEDLLEDIEFAQEGCPTESVLVQDTPFA